ncbi:MAG: class I SAM-dependent methyltransferase [Sandaracinaceae bacterium]
MPVDRLAHRPSFPPSPDDRRALRARRLERLPELMASLYETGDWYVSIPPGAEMTFEESYWTEVVDPDGCRRNRLEERRRCLEDLATELAYLRALPPGRFLDAGCGLGWVLSALDDTWVKEGVETSEVAAAHARRFGEVRVARLESLPYEDGVFDVVFCHHVIEHLRRPERGLEEMRRVLRPGGHLILGTPDFDSGAARRYRERYRLVHDPTHISLFSNDSAHRFLRDHGFQIRKVDYPYFETRHFSRQSLERLLDPLSISPPFYGSFMTFYCTKADSR